MKKKIMFFSLFCSLLVTAVALCGCGTNTLKIVKDNLSECTKVFYAGECDQFSATLSVGEREEDYMQNGKSENKVPFALLSLNLGQKPDEDKIIVRVTIGDETKSVLLELNEFNGLYMTDLQREMSGEESVSVSYDNTALTMENVSKTFGVDSENALEIACKEIGNLILKKRSGRVLNAECYLRVLDKKVNNLDGYFWVFTVVNNSGEDYSVIISAADGKVLIKSE